jgi:hypothetical protein
MGGNNSGRRPDPDAKLTVEACARWALDVRVLGRALSQPGTAFVYSGCPNGGPSRDRLLCAVHPDGLHLAYKPGRGDGEWVTETVRLDTTSCHYGGQRYWFRCPRCHRRTATVYYAVRPFRCRVCLGLTYRSQRTQVVDRNLDYWQTLLRRLGGSGSINQEPRPRPKGMQRRVYRCLRHEIERARFRFWRSVAKYYKFFPSDPDDGDEDWDAEDW